MPTAFIDTSEPASRPLESSFTALAGADLSGAQFHIVRRSAETKGDTPFVNVSSESAGDAQSIVGVLQNKPGSGEPATVGDLGESFIAAANSIGPGQWLTTNASGRATTAGSGDVAFARSVIGAENAGGRLVGRLFPPFRLGGAP